MSQDTPKQSMDRSQASELLKMICVAPFIEVASDKVDLLGENSRLVQAMVNCDKPTFFDVGLLLAVPHSVLSNQFKSEVQSAEEIKTAMNDYLKAESEQEQMASEVAQRLKGIWEKLEEETDFKRKCEAAEREQKALEINLARSREMHEDVMAQLSSLKAEYASSIDDKIKIAEQRLKEISEKEKIAAKMAEAIRAMEEKGYDFKESKHSLAQLEKLNDEAKNDNQKMISLAKSARSDEQIKEMGDIALKDEQRHHEIKTTLNTFVDNVHKEANALPVQERSTFINTMMKHKDDFKLKHGEEFKTIEAAHGSQVKVETVHRSIKETERDVNKDEVKFEDKREVVTEDQNDLNQDQSTHSGNQENLTEKDQKFQSEDQATKTEAVVLQGDRGELSLKETGAQVEKGRTVVEGAEKKADVKEEGSIKNYKVQPDPKYVEISIKYKERYQAQLEAKRAAILAKKQDSPNIESSAGPGSP